MKHNCLKGFLISLFILIFFSLDANAQPNFVYTNNDRFFTNSVTAFSVSPDGTLTQVPGSPFLTGGNGRAGGFYATNRINLSVVGTFLFVSNAGSANISVFSINPANGVLTPVPGSPFPSGGLSGFETSLAVTPDNRFLLAANSGINNLVTFSIAANGALTPIPGSPFPLVQTPDGIKVSPDGRFLSVAFVFHDTVGMYSIGANGSITPVPGSPFLAAAVGMVAGLDMNCAGTLLFGGEANAGGTNVDVYNIAPNGALTPVPGSPFNNPGIGDNSNVVLLSPDERFLFASNQDTNTVVVFNVAANGSLSVVPGSPFPTGALRSSGMAINRAGTLLYVAHFDNSAVAVLRIASNGALTPVPGSPFFTGEQFFSGLVSLVAFPSKSCSTFDFCVQDDSNGTILKFNSNTGEYVFMNCRKGITLSGIGAVTKTINNDFCKVELFDRGIDPKRSDRTVLALVNPCTGRGDGRVTINATGQTYLLADTNIFNNVCACP